LTGFVTFVAQQQCIARPRSSSCGQCYRRICAF